MSVTSEGFQSLFYYKFYVKHTEIDIIKLTIYQSSKRAAVYIITCNDEIALRLIEFIIINSEPLIMMTILTKTFVKFNSI